MLKRLSCILLIGIIMINMSPVLAYGNGEPITAQYIGVEQGYDGYITYKGEEARLLYEASAAPRRNFPSVSVPLADILGIAEKPFSSQVFTSETEFALAEYVLFKLLRGEYQFTLKAKGISPNDIIMLTQLAYTYFPHHYGSYMLYYPNPDGVVQYNISLSVNPSYTEREKQAAYDYAQENLIGKNLTSKQIAKNIHDYLANLVSYDYEAISKPNRAHESHGQYAYCALEEHKSVCSGYANAFSLISMYAGLNAPAVSGHAGGSHRWNTVVQGQSPSLTLYLVDVTWGDQATHIIYDYFWKTNAEMLEFESNNKDVAHHKPSSNVIEFIEYLNKGGTKFNPDDQQELPLLPGENGVDPNEYELIDVKPPSKLPEFDRVTQPENGGLEIEEKAIVPSSNEGAYIDLYLETLTLPGSYSVAAYSLDGGSVWKAGSPGSSMSKLLNKGMTLSLTDKFDSILKKPAAEAEVISFPKILQREKTPKFIPNYLILADSTGATNGRWILSSRGSQTPVYEGIEIAPTSDGKTPSGGKWFSMSADGVGIISGKTKKMYLIRTAPVASNGEFKPMGKQVKIRPANNVRATKYRANYKTEIIKLKKGDVIYAGQGFAEPEPVSGGSFTVEEGKAYMVMGKSATASITDYLSVQEYRPVTIWKQATEKKPASDPQIYFLAARGDALPVTLQGKSGKIKLPKEYEAYNTQKNKWGTLPSVIPSGELDVRLKAKAKATGVIDTGKAASNTYKLSVVYADSQQNAGQGGKRSILSALISGGGRIKNDGLTSYLSHERYNEVDSLEAQQLFEAGSPFAMVLYSNKCATSLSLRSVFESALDAYDGISLYGLNGLKEEYPEFILQGWPEAYVYWPSLLVFDGSDIRCVNGVRKAGDITQLLDAFSALPATP